ncbi:MAG: SHOCT domain-containing protein [Thermonemataceae bacterium]|nr:SHOCT domain-containing protein [Thermonemataceae bacterium]
MEKDKYQILQEWNDLLQSGVITEAEFLAKKQEIFGSDLPQKQSTLQSKSFTNSRQNLKFFKIGGAVLGTLILAFIVIKALPKASSEENTSTTTSKTENASEEKEESKNPIGGESKNIASDTELSSERVFAYLYEGKVANMPVTFKIRAIYNDSEVFYDGYYFYNDRKINIDLDGYFNANGRGGANPDAPLKILEYYEGKITGKFNLKRDDFGKESISGTWSTPDDKKKFPFVLNKVRDIIFDNSDYSGEWEIKGLYKDENGEIAKNGYGEVIFWGKSLNIKQKGDILTFSISTFRSTGCTGSVEGEAEIISNKAVYMAKENTPCKLTFTLNADIIEVEDECPDFHGVSCTFSGTFRRKL